MSEVFWRTRATFLTLFFILSASASVAHANEGDVDTSFGFFNNGVSFLSSFRSYPNNDSAVAVMVQPNGDANAPDGNIIVVANINESSNGSGPPYFNSIAITRLSATGLYDETFGIGGEKLISGSATAGFEIKATGAALDVNGRIAISGYRTVSGKRSMAVWMLTPNGALDTTGFSGGTLTLDRGVAGAQDQALAVYAANGIDIMAGTLSDFIVAGSVQNPGQVSVGAAIVVHPNGTLNFDGSGNSAFTAGPFVGARYTRTAISAPAATCNSELNSIAFKTTNVGIARTYVGGNLNCPDDSSHWTYAASLDNARMLNPAFGNSGGYAYFAFESTIGAKRSFATAIGIDPYERAIVAGYVRDVSTFAPIAMGAAMLNTAGALDNNFAGVGYRSITWPGSVGASASALHMQRNGKILLAGRVVTGSIGDFALARVNLDGSSDTAYGDPAWSGAGRTYHFLIENQFADAGAAATAFMYGERVVLAGYTQDPRPGLTDHTYAGVMRIQGDLILGDSFGIYLDGRLPTP